MWFPQRAVGEIFCMPSRTICVSSVRRFPFWSVRDSMCVVVGVFFRIGVLVATDQRSLLHKDSSAGARLCVSPSVLGDFTMWLPHLVCKKKVLIASPAIFDRDVGVRYGDYVHRFVSLLNLGPHGSGGSSRRHCQHFRAIREHCCGRDTTSVLAHVYWGFPHSSPTMWASKLAIVSRRLDVVATAPGWDLFLGHERFVFRMFCRFPFWSVRYLMRVIVGVLSRIGVLWPGFSDCQLFLKGNDSLSCACMLDIPHWIVTMCATNLASDLGHHYVIAAAFGGASRWHDWDVREFP